MSDKLIASEALFGFAAWLTTREETTKMGASEDCAPIVGLISQFCEENNLPDPRDGWENNLVHPSGECSGPTASDKPINKVEEAMNVLMDAMKEDCEPGSYAHGWHCNIAMMCYDALHDAKTQPLSETDHDWNHRTANDAASRFMKLCFGVETKG